MLYIKKQIKGMTPYQPGKPIEEVKRELGLATVHKMASNENPYGAPQEAKQAIQAAAADPEIYPDGYAAELRQAVAEELNVGEKQLLFGAGSDEVILMLCRAMLGPDTNTVMAVPSFSQYKHNAVIEGAEIREIPAVHGEHQLEAMLEAIDENTRIIWVCNPNNPSGAYINEEAFVDFLDRVPENVLVVSDEAYIEYVTAKDYPDTLKLLKEYPNLLLLRTFSKAYGLASLRVGYGIGHEELIQSLDPVRPPFNVTAVAQRAATAALKDRSFIENCREQNKKELEKMTAFCEGQGLDYVPSQTNFLLIHTGVAGSIVFNEMLKKGIIIRSGEALGYPESIRVTIGTEEQNEAFRKTLSEVLEHQQAKL